MSLLAMPPLVACAASEMLYVLNQRLVVQDMLDAKAWVFFGDIVRTIFDSNFMKSLFEPQPIFPLSSLKQIFEKSVQSSTNKMSAASFDKLFDMSLMHVKVQFLSCASAEEIVQVVLNHVFELRKICAVPECRMLDGFVILLESKFGQISPADFLKMRHALLNILSPLKPKVTLLLREKFQDEDGTLIARTSGYLAPGTNLKPGTLRLTQSNKLLNLLNPRKSTLWWILPEPFTQPRAYFHDLYSSLGLCSSSLKLMRLENIAVPPPQTSAFLRQQLAVKPAVEEKALPTPLEVPVPIAQPVIAAEVTAPILKNELNAFAAALRKARPARQLSTSVGEWNEPAPVSETNQPITRPGKLSGDDILELMKTLK